VKTKLFFRVSLLVFTPFAKALLLLNLFMRDFRIDLNHIEGFLHRKLTTSISRG